MMKFLNNRFPFSFALFVFSVTYVNCLKSVRPDYYDIFTSEQKASLENAKQYQIPGCEPRQIYLFSRHGARTPGNDNVEVSKEFLSTYKKLRDSNVLTHVSRVLDEIEITFADTPSMGLTEQGQKVIQGIGQRFKRRYPTLFDDDIVAENQIDTLTSDLSQALDSSLNFLKGVYEYNSSFINAAKRIRFDPLIMRLFDKSCPKYLRTVKHNKDAYAEEEKFEKGPVMQELVDKFIKRHSLQGMEVKPSSLRAIFTVCSHEMIHSMKKNWCKLFVDDDYYPISYNNDIFVYNIFGPGHPDNALVALPIYQDLFKNMDKFIREDLLNITAKKSNKTVIRFGHLEQIVPILAALNLYIDKDPVTADNYDKLGPNRRYNASIWGPFTAQFSFVLYKCPIEGDDINSQYKVHVLLNELPIKVIEGGSLKCTEMKKSNKKLADDGSLCDYVHFKSQLLPFIDQNLREACQ